MSRPVNILRVLIVILMLAFLFDAVWYSGTLKPWLEPTPVLSLLGLITGFLILSWQIDRQAQDKLRLDIYSEIGKRIEATSQPIAQITSTALLLVRDLRRFQNLTPEQMPASRYTPSFLTDLFASISESVIGLSAELEHYEIVMPAFRNFRERLRGVLNNLGPRFQDFAQRSLWLVRTDDRGPLRWPPSDTEITELESLSTEIMTLCAELGRIIFELREEAQNQLIGRLFPRL